MSTGLAVEQVHYLPPGCAGRDVFRMSTFAHATQTLAAYCSKMTTPARSPAVKSGSKPGLAFVGMGAFAAWLGLISWDNDYDVRGGVETGPWEPWQVISVVAIISVVLVVALLVDQDPLGVILILSGTITFCFVLSFTVLAPPAPDASLWPIGATLICMAALIGCSILAVTVTTARRSLSRAGIR